VSFPERGVRTSPCIVSRCTILTRQRFGIELAPEVVQADGNVKNLAWRICNAKKVLVRCHISLNRDFTDISRRHIVCRAARAETRPIWVDSVATILE
jgi:hypothetical protein